MTPQQATLLQDAAGLVAAHLRGDHYARDVLLGAYTSDETFPLLVDAFAYYITAAVQVSARLAASSWQSVLMGLPEYHVGLLPGVAPDWAAARALVIDLFEPAVATGRGSSMEVTSCVEGAYGLAVSITSVLGRGERGEALAWTGRLSLSAARES